MDRGEAVAEMAVERALRTGRRAAVSLGQVACSRRIDHETAKPSVTRPSLNIGIEEEYQTVDPDTRDLRSHIQAEIVQKGKMILAERVKPEMHQSVVEIGTGVCREHPGGEGRRSA